MRPMTCRWTFGAALVVWLAGGVPASAAPAATPTVSAVVQPVYVPAASLDGLLYLRGLSGEVTVRVGVRRDGTVAEAEVQSGPSALHEISLRAARQARFRCLDCSSTTVAGYTLIYAFDWADDATIPEEPKLEVGAGYVRATTIGVVYMAPVCALTIKTPRTSRCFYLWHCG